MGSLDDTGLPLEHFRVPHVVLATNPFFESSIPLPRYRNGYAVKPAHMCHPTGQVRNIRGARRTA